MLLSIIIVSYNTKELTLEAVRSAVRDINRSPSLIEKAEIIIIDNNSKDDSAAALKHFAKESSVPIRIIINDKNLGFAAANNIGLNKAKGQYLLLLNSDTLVQAGALQKMVVSFESFPAEISSAPLSSERKNINKLGILAASLINWDGTYQAQGGDTPTLFSLKMHMIFLDDLPLIGRFLPSTQHTGRNSRPHSMNSDNPNQRLIKKDWVGGTAMMIRREVIKEIGLLDENIFMYGEDMEFCLRAKNRHWDIAEHPTARITHFQNASSSSKNAIVGEINGYHYIWSKHKPLWQLYPLKMILYFGVIIRIILFDTIAKDKEKAEVYREALRAIPKE